ncbi:MAG: hypothetical protein MI810_02295 [Flavobacteriales bacterium]|nr:hypothetical protein [Flavobacteriales bacterium]
MPILNRPTLKSFYETGDRPTEDQFGALIDSSLNLLEDQNILGLRVYDSARAYTVGESVIHNSVIYQCTANTTGTFDPGAWEKIAGAVEGGLNYRGSWNADTNVPDLLTTAVSSGDYYVVGVAGGTDLDGITSWEVGDWAIHNGTSWEKVDNTDMVTDAENIAGDGAGVFKEKDGTTLMFKRIQNSDESIVISEDDDENFINLAINFDDSSSAPNRVWSGEKISERLADKADKVSGATANNFASLNGAGNIQDSGVSEDDFLPSDTEAIDIPVTPTGNITATNVQDALEQLAKGTSLTLVEYQAGEKERRTASLAPEFRTAFSFSFVPPEKAHYILEWYFEMAKQSPSGTMTVAARVVVDKDIISEVQPRYGSNEDFTSFSGFNAQSFTGGKHSIRIDFARVTTGDERQAIIRRIRIKIIKAS